MRKQNYALISIFTLAFILRIAVYLIHTHNWYDYGDAAHYYCHAKNIAAGKGFVIFAEDSLGYSPEGKEIDSFISRSKEISRKYYYGVVPYGKPNAFWDPLLSYLMSVFIRAGDDSLNVYRFFTCILGAFSCVLIYLISSRLFDKKAGLAAALLMALDFNSILYSSILMTETVAILFLLATVLFFNQEKDGKIQWLILTGISAGLTYLTRANLFIIVPLLIFFAFLQLPGTARYKAAFILIGFIIAGAPWWARNLEVKGRIGFFPNKGAFNFWYSTASIASLARDMNINLRRHPQKAVEILSQVNCPEAAYITSIKGATEEERAGDMWNTAVKFIKANPGLAVKRYFRHLVELFDPVPEFGNFLQKLILFATTVTIFGLGFAGMFLFFRDEYRRAGTLFSEKTTDSSRSFFQRILNFFQDKEAIYFLLCYFLLFALSSAFFRFGFRFRMPANLVFFIFAGYLVMNIFNRHKNICD